MKRVVVTMKDECAAMLKAYASLFQVTQGEVLYEAARSHIHGHAWTGCKGTCALLDMNGIALDKRAHKECYGFACKACKHNKACRIGQHEGSFECDPRWEQLMADQPLAQEMVDLPPTHPVARFDSSHSSRVNSPRHAGRSKGMSPHIDELFSQHRK